MRLIRELSGIYRGSEDGRYYLFLRWHATGRRDQCQLVDFTTRAEAACFLTGARSACQASNKVVRFDTLTATEYQQATDKTQRQ